MVSYGLYNGRRYARKPEQNSYRSIVGIKKTRRMTMKALILKEYKRFAFEDTPDPICGSDEVLIKVAACAICGSDIHGMDGSTGRRIPPVIMGHEASGTIVETGSDVSSFKKGDRVTFDSTIYCGRCAYCREGKINLCNDRRVLGVSCSEYRQNGAFAEYITVPQRILYPIPDSLSFEHAAMAEPLAIALHAVNISDVRINSKANMKLLWILEPQRF
jgi:L-iditol 2-dehydrogenase